MAPARIPLLERILAKVAPTEDPDACWIFTGTKNAKGYGKIYAGDGDRHHMLYAHRALNECLLGPLDAGIFLHHTCYTPSCVNYRHLERREDCKHHRRKDGA